MSEDPQQKYPAYKLGEYTVVGEIAEGTFGKVKMAVHTVTGQKVAMKFISKQAIAKHRTKTRVQREVEYMRTLRHPHIIKLYEVISTPTDIIIVLEYAGGELFNYIVANGRMSEPQARRFFQQLISGIEYSHHLKIVHRDLKPENVLLDDDLNVKIADFGLSNEIKDGDFLKTSCGSPNYAAPEVIRGGLYTGPEIDVWSCGVILYVMLCGRLPFEDDDVQTLFTKISQGVYHLPGYLSTDAKGLINGMLAVDPVKRITVPEIMQHPFFTIDLPKYLSPLPQQGPVLGTLSSLVTPPKAIDFEIIEGLGRIEDDVVEELASRMDGVDKEDVWECLRRDDGPQGNAVKVAYMLLRDKRRAGRSLAEFEEQERDAKLAVMDPRHPLSPNAVSPGGGTDLEENPFDSEFNDYDDDDEDDELDFSTPLTEAESNNFAVLNSSLPEQLPEPHHLQSYANAKRATPVKEKKQHRTKWHFGIRSRSPPMEVMLEIYRTLKTLGMEWKEKENLGGLGASALLQDKRNGDRAKIERAREYDGYVDLRAASSIYFIETRARVQDVVVLMNLQLYMVDHINYLVDFHHKKTYKASVEEGAGKFDMAHPDYNLSETASESSRSVKDLNMRDDEVVSPYIFMDVACRLILELAGGGGE
ncbi:CAMK/CAMKL/AMPK protein kinase [Trametes versicolor FP-101664 SS1]|uniref:CAMK/CAMKL/AMPK protein kinase n=1 Tax=Trametes versicolor (strain FP-101664) TaxID=717944 RepID=UPI00046232A7|nr:CAMK/CAMKL/AMPK protein kinase [Trametes versicolor FP-101664 SS1]EIW64478.1 CAMK/CAMKL/AMPK protein kinase [Trametes versicolor FP-101664 SS1]